MTTEELDALWGRLLEQGKARWMPGMLSEPAWCGDLLEDYDAANCVLPWRHTADGLWFAESTDIDLADAVSDTITSPVPNWTDPATLGCLLGQVREAWGDPLWYTAPSNWRRGEWACLMEGHAVFVAATEAEALLRALEAAP